MIYLYGYNLSMLSFISCAESVTHIYRVAPPQSGPSLCHWTNCSRLGPALTLSTIRCSSTHNNTLLPSGAPWLTPGFQWGSCYSIFSFMCMLCRSIFVLFSFGNCVVYPSNYGFFITPLVSSNSFYREQHWTPHIVRSVLLSMLLTIVTSIKYVSSNTF